MLLPVGRLTSRFAKPWIGVSLLGRNAQFTRRGVMTDLPGGAATAKSVFRHLTKGQRVKPLDTRRFTLDNRYQIRYGPDGVRIDILHRNGRVETIHFQ